MPRGEPTDPAGKVTYTYDVGVAALGETQTMMLTANNGSFTNTFGNTMLGVTRQTGNGLTVSFVRAPDGQLIAATTGSSSAYYLTDNLNSTVGVVDSNGAKTRAHSYDPYGRTRTATATGSAAANAFRYAGGLYDATTGATKFAARYYDTNTGRFTQPDPSGQEQNPDAYAGNNLINYVDPTGLMDLAEGAAIVLIGGIAAVAAGGLLSGVGAFAVDDAVTGAVVSGAATAAMVEGSTG